MVDLFAQLISLQLQAQEEHEGNEIELADQREA